jgi:hypothetical protein
MDAWRQRCVLELFPLVSSKDGGTSLVSGGTICDFIANALSTSRYSLVWGVRHNDFGLLRRYLYLFL